MCSFITSDAAFQKVCVWSSVCVCVCVCVSMLRTMLDRIVRSHCPRNIVLSQSNQSEWPNVSRSSFFNNRCHLDSILRSSFARQITCPADATTPNCRWSLCNFDLLSFGYKLRTREIKHTLARKTGHPTFWLSLMFYNFYMFKPVFINFILIVDEFIVIWKNHFVCSNLKISCGKNEANS